MKVTLRPLTEGDADPLAELTAANLDAIAETRPDALAEGPDATTVEGQRELIARYEEANATGRGRAYGIVVDGRLAGLLSIMGTPRSPSGSANIGYWVAAEFGGRGVATAAVAAAIPLAFGELGLHRLEAGTLRDNFASQRVLEKNGFERIGVARGLLKIGGVWRDHVLFQLLEDDVQRSV